mmetsp:Transcript_59311/g.119016  ORF Transcript_59311/g.119016 Transcript_59311/m.119016 type:complete len:118 (+) Transcript_59311:57-410(+)
MRTVALLLAIVGLASAFVPQSGPFAAVARGNALNMGYVPDGMDPKVYAAMKKKEEDAKLKNKKKMSKGSIEDLTTFNARMEKKFPNQPGAGHVYVKMKGKALGKTQSDKKVNLGYGK